jgi:peroxiredoxin
LVVVLAPALALGGTPSKTGVVGEAVGDFTLRDYRGAERSLREFADRKLVVVAFTGTECPLARLYGPRLAQLAREYEPKGVAFIGICSNQQDSISAIAQYARDGEIKFPILKDVGNAVADQFGAVRTPEVFVLDAGRVVRYRGRIDDQYGIGFARPRPGHRDLAAALDELLAGKPVTTPVTTAPGCFIGRVQPAVKAGPVTYSKHIAPILQKHCVECHRPGEIGPFSMTSYREVAGWTDTIEEVLRDGRMPPWHADPAYGHFSNDSRLPEAEKQLIFDWIKGGAPEGDPRDLPKPVAFTHGWRIPKPDLVLRIPHAFHVPAQGDVPYQFIVVDPGFKEDKWVKAAEIRPTCRAVVHHVLVFVQPPGGGHDRYGGFAANWLAGTVPGARPQILPEGTAKFVPAGSRFLLQIHYTTNGKPQTDQTCLGLVFADPKEVKKEVSTEMAANPKFAIPPNTGRYPVESDNVVEEDSILLELMPHTHLRGKTFRYEAFYPDGRSEVLLDLPRYDFNWQNSYTLAEPKRLPKGTRIHCLATYDNSKDNPSNPNPNVTVRWGDQTWEEMMIGYYNVVPADQDLQKNPRPVGKYVPKPLPPLDPALKERARHALESAEAFDAFAAAVHKALPQVDRVCLTTVTDGNLRVDRVSYPGQVARHVLKAGFEGHSHAYALGHFALLGSFFALPDITKLRAADLGYLGQTLTSSAHVPVVLEGRPGTLNFWSKQKDAFPEPTHEMLKALGEVVNGRDS